MRKTVFIIFALCFLCPKIDAQQFISMRAGYLSDKLPSSTVSRVFQDNNGFMWFGTLDGLCRYDGYRVITFRSDSDNPHLLTNNEISCFEEDHNNNLLIGTRKGFNILNKSTYKISSPDKPELNDQNIRYIKVTKNGDIWISIEDCIVRYDKDFNLIKSYENSLPRASINYFYEDNYNNLWALIWSHGQ